MTDRSSLPGRGAAPEGPGGPPPPSDPVTPAAVQRHLRAAVFGHRIFYYPSIGSTNDRALELAAAGEPEGGLVLAEEQVQGRGRRDRTWSSRPYLGLYASLILRPAIPAPRAPLLTFMAAVATADALNEIPGLKARIKWPNDVLAGGRKIAGVLGEVRGADPEVREMVVGVGVNVHHLEEDFPPELRSRATSVRIASGRPAERAPILARLLEGFEHRYARALRDGPATLLREWQTLSSLQPGDPVRVLGPTGPAQGTFAGIDEEGGLKLQAPDGRVLRIAFGEIVEGLE
ncbi:MAG TPA: biotin--[acetyl-CoA-carboxylase] ligase [Candidatus Polarisedimenticolia bacterium]|nr:biotin--[acetyl-CoA-carboxylase] ligase [Candidatus Polarisedimenticolia bacterium]